jgi:hypothetical protein
LDPVKTALSRIIDDVVWHRGKKVAILGIGLFFATGLATVCTSFVFAFGPQVTVHRDDAGAFYRSEVQDLLQLPSEATVEQVEHTVDWVDHIYVLTIATKTTADPEKWVRNLWAANRFSPGAKINSTEYMAYQSSSLHHGHRRIYYNAKSNRYMVEIGTD